MMMKYSETIIKTAKRLFLDSSDYKLCLLSSRQPSQQLHPIFVLAPSRTDLFYKFVCCPLHKIWIFFMHFGYLFPQLPFFLFFGIFLIFWFMPTFSWTFFTLRDFWEIILYDYFQLAHFFWRCDGYQRRKWNRQSKFKF